MSARGTNWLTMFNREPWQAEGVCRTTDPEIFFPEKGGSTRAAKRICMQCPVREKCLDWALEVNERFGVLGGYSERERRRLRRGEDVPLSALKPASKVTGRCGWCNMLVHGDRKYCGRSCTNSAFRARGKDDAA